MLLRHLIITSFFKNKCYRVFFYYVTSCIITSLRVRGNRREGKTPQTYGGRKFIGTNPRGVHAASRGEIWRVEKTANRGSNTTNQISRRGRETTSLF